MKDRFNPEYLPQGGSCCFIARRLLALFALTFFAGCATPQAEKALVHPKDFMAQQYGFITDGQTMREEVLLRLGIPSAQFEGERILTYQLVMDESGSWYIRAPVRDFSTGLRVWNDNTCSLVLVFDDTGVLERHALVLPNLFTEPHE